jgi:hypothetical protein
MKLSTFMIPLVLILGFTGCETTGVVEGEPAFSDIGLTHHRKDLVLKDVALPEDFVMVPGTFFHGTENFRYGELMYQGNLSVDDIFFYYKKHMPTHGWKENSLKQFETNARLAYSKNGEKCTILLREGASMTEIKIIIEQIKMEQNQI